jgi:NTE family protein
MRRRIGGLVAAVVLSTSVSVAAHAQASQAQPSVDEKPPAHRPRIGLALGGGGARGAAHIGVLEVLEELHVPIDFVAGTSMGSIVAGLYASGLPVDRIEKELRERDWSNLLSDRAPYRDLVWRRKEDEGRYLLDLELGLRGHKLLIPTGLRAGQKLGFELEALLLPVAGVEDFSKLPIPFRAVATDVETGEAVVLDHGDLTQSILASMTVPGVFAPVEIDGRMLVDGGMANNLPVEVVRAMGADFVIAVDVGTPLSTRESIQSFVGVTSQAFTFLTTRNSTRSASLADLVIRPSLSGIGSGDFARTAEAIPIGVAAAEASRAALERIALSPEEWAAWRARTAQPPLPGSRIASVRVEGNQRVDERVILARARLHAGDSLEVPRLRAAIRRVYGLDDFQWVRFRFEGFEEDPSLVLQVHEKPWGPTYLHFGLEGVDDLAGDATYGIKMNVTSTDWNARGGEWRNDFRIGSHPFARTEFFQPLDFSGKLFVAPWLQIERFKTPVFDDGHQVADYAVDARTLELDGGIEYGRFGEVRLGVYRGRVLAHVETGASDLPRFDVESGGISLGAVFETLDRPAIPRHGSRLGMRLLVSREALGANDSYDRLEAGVSHFLGRGRHTLFGIADLGTNLGSRIPAYDEFVVGGLFSLGGYSEGELRGQFAGGLTVGYHFRLFSLPAGFGEGVYAGVALDGRNAWATSQEIRTGNLRYGATVILGADTIIGPLFLAYGRAEGGRDQVYLTLGRSL